MLKSPKNRPKKAAPKLIAVIKNGHTDAELDEMGERWANHQGPYLTLAETIAIEKAKREVAQPAGTPVTSPMTERDRKGL